MALTNIWFCWERSSTGRWGAACYHGEKPKAEKISDGDRPSRSLLQEVPADCVDGQDNPLFGKLVALFPAPVEVA